MTLFQLKKINDCLEKLSMIGWTANFINS